MAVVNLPGIAHCSTSALAGVDRKISSLRPTLVSYFRNHELELPASSVSAGRTPFSPTRRDVKRHAKFQQFTSSDGDALTEDIGTSPVLQEDGGWTNSEDVPEDERADGVLPDSLEGAVLQSSESAALFVKSGGYRAIVELLLPDLLNMGNEGDQLKLWNVTRLFLDDLQSRLDPQQMKAVFPDAGVCAMLESQWKGSKYKFASLNSRKPVNVDDEVVVLVQPDYQMLSAVEKIASSLEDAVDGPPRPLIMYNPILQSGEVGIGLNVRRMKEFFLSTFNPVYSMRSLSFGAIFRRYPGPWKVFFDDVKLPGRYVLANENPVRPVLEDVEMLFMTGGKADDGSEREPGPLQNLLGVFSSMSRFMQSLSR